jgi:hypothetical protein
MTNEVIVGAQRIRSLTTRGMVVPLKFTLGTSAAIVKAVPLLLVDLLNEDGVTGRAIAHNWLDRQRCQLGCPSSQMVNRHGFADTLEFRLGFCHRVWRNNFRHP